MRHGDFYGYFMVNDAYRRVMNFSKKYEMRFYVSGFSLAFSHSIIIFAFYNCFLYLSKVNIREGPIRSFSFFSFFFTRRIERVKSIHTLFQLVRSLFPCHTCTYKPVFGLSQ